MSDTTYWRHPGYEGQDPFVFEVTPIDPDPEVSGLDDEDYDICEGETEGEECVTERVHATVKNDLALMYCRKHALEGATEITKDQYDASEEW